MYTYWRNSIILKSKTSKEAWLNGFNRPIPFEELLTILVSHFYLLRDERKGGESARVNGMDL